MSESEKEQNEATPEGQEEGQESGGGKSKKKLIIIGGAVGAALLIGGVVAALFLTGVLGGKKSEHGKEVAGHGQAADGKEHAGVPGEVFYYEMDEFIVNLNSTRKQQAFLKMKIALELADQTQVPVIEKNMIRIRDIFQVYLREVREDDLRGSAGLYRLRQELLLRLNKIVAPAKVNDILFKEFFVQ